MNIINKFIRKYSYLLVTKLVITDYKDYCENKSNKSALFSYLVHPMLLPPKFRNHIQFSNSGIAQEIPRALNELGYSVDIIDFTNKNWIPKKKYDIFIGHGGVNFRKIVNILGQDTIKIYFSTGLYWRDFNQNVINRIYNFTHQKGYIIPPERFVKTDEEYANQIADTIICLGNNQIIKSYKKVNPVVFNINNAVYPFTHMINLKKNIDEGRKHFLFFSGFGNIHKGLDLLLEAFSEINLHLHICQRIEPEFMNIYQNELTKHKNIHLHGYLEMRSLNFLDLASKCNWVILPTCAEGQPGSVLECMAHGLIPILSDYANIDLHDWGIRIPELSVDCIRSLVLRYSNMEINECNIRSNKVLEVIKSNYSVENFRKSFKNAIINSIETKG